MSLWRFERRAYRVLDFDIENRPLAYMGEDYTSGEITAIAAMFIGEPEVVYTWLLGRESYEEMLEGFRSLFDQADVVTGHYIRKHDLPIINGALAEIGHPPLKDKLTSDTKMDFIKSMYISESQENLAEMLDLEAEKFHMSNTRWRRANRLTPEGLALTEARVVADIHQHVELRAELIRRGLLGPAKVWRSSA